MHWSDGNLHALAQYEKEQDRLDEMDRAQEEAQQQLADDMFDGYMSDNHNVIDEVDDSIVSDTDKLDDMLKKLRDNWTADGRALRTAYMKVIAGVCKDIAGDVDDVDKARRGFGL